MSRNTNLNKAKQVKNDEFYTKYSDVEEELSHYIDYFENKIVYCNCDNPYESNFYKYFFNNFKKLKLKKLITTCYSETTPYKSIVTQNSDEVILDCLKENGDFRSQECVELLKEADIIVTNPPFSLFREFISQLIKYDKNFIVLGNPNAITYNEIFPLIKENKMWLGITKNAGLDFKIPKELKDNYPQSYTDSIGDVYVKVWAKWFTNLNYKERHEKLDLHETYSPDKYPKYDNWDAIEVKKVSLIPVDFDGLMGVPITFMDKFCPEQFEIVGKMSTTTVDKYNFGYPKINGKKKYNRIVIRWKEH